MKSDVTLHVGDAEDPAMYPPGPFNLILCDPPFLPQKTLYRQIRPDTTHKLQPIECPSPKEYPGWWDRICILWAPLLAPTGWLIFKSDTIGALKLYEITSRHFTFEDLLIWDKTLIGLGYRIRHQHEFLCIYRPKKAKDSFFWRPKRSSQAREISHGGSRGLALPSIIRQRPDRAGVFGDQGPEHINATPWDLWLKIIPWFCPSGGLIVDPFAGSGSIGWAALNKKCRYWGIEKDPALAEMAHKRLLFAKQQTTLEGYK